MKKRNSMSSRRSAILGAATIVGTVILALAATEAVLRAVGFRYELRVHVIESTAPEGGEVRKGYTIDPYLIWVDKGYYERLKSANGRRIDIAYLGDSCTQFGNYDKLLSALIEERTGSRVSGVKLGVAGWTTHQGLRQMERDIAPLEPRIVTIYFGWNDHWLSIGLTDRQVERVNRTALGRLQSLRLGQLLMKAYVGVLREKDRPVVRVGEGEFRENLADMVRIAKSVGAVPVLITAPTSHVAGREPAYLAGRWVADLSDLVPVHRRYEDIVREVARDEDAVLCDLAAVLDGLGSQAARDALFYKDGIHFTAQGNAWAARCLFDCLESDSRTAACFVDTKMPR